MISVFYEMSFKHFLVENTTTAQLLRNNPRWPKQVVTKVKMVVQQELTNRLVAQPNPLADKNEITRINTQQHQLKLLMPQLVNHFTYQAIIEIESNAAKEAVTKADPNHWHADAEGWARNMTRSKLNNYADFIMGHLNDTEFQSKLNTPNYTFKNMEDDSEEWHALLAMRARGQGADGRTIITLDHLGGGWKGWKWISLDRASCNKEGAAGGHCGNSGGRADDNILSLRDSSNFVHATFIVNNMSLGEMKGKANAKPISKYHPAIIELLKSEYVGTIKGGGWLPENNFALSDLDKATQERLIKQKPYLNQPFQYMRKNSKPEEFMSLLEETFEESFVKIFNSPGGKKNSGTSALPKGEILVVRSWQEWPECHEEVEKFQNTNVENFGFWLDNDEYEKVDTSYLWSYDYTSQAVDDLDDRNEKTIEKIIAKLVEDEEIEVDEDDDLANKIKEYEPLEDAIRQAYADGVQIGTESEAYEHITKSLENEDENGFWIEWSRTPFVDEKGRDYPIEMRIAINDLEELYKQFGGSGEEFVDFISTEYSQPYNGYNNFDEEIFNERLSELLWDIIAEVGLE